jgi:hypothetical protein
MRARYALGLLLGLTLLLPVRADDDDKSERMPFNPFETAQVGDWTLFDATWKGGDIPDRHGTLLWKIGNIENDRDVTVVVDQRQNDTNTSAQYVFSKKENPPVEQFGRVFSGVAFPGKVFDHKRHGDNFGVEGKSFQGWKVTFRSETDNDTNGKYVLFFSRDVKASGTVICRYDGKDGSKVEIRVLGYGTKAGTDWGKSLDSPKKPTSSQREQDLGGDGDR